MKKIITAVLTTIVLLSLVGWRYNAIPPFIQAQIDSNTALVSTNTASSATNTANIATNTANIATNTANIATNVIDIATNVLDIAANTAEITAAKGNAGLPVTIVFNVTAAGTSTYTVPTGYDLLVVDAYGWKTDAAAAGTDTWDLQNNDGSAANIFAQEAIGTDTLADKAKAVFADLEDTEDEVESGDTLDLVAAEETDDDGANGIVYVVGVLKVAD